MANVKTMRVMGSRPTTRPEPHPAPIPLDAVIYNGPRPLLGSEGDGLGLSWQGEPILGSFYGAVVPGDPQADRWIEMNMELGAVVVEYLTPAQVLLQLAAHYREELMLSDAEIDQRLGQATDAAIWQAFVTEGLHLDLEPALA